MANQFDIPGLFKKVFGYEVPQKLDLPAAPARLESSKKGQPFYSSDLYGREFFMPVTFEGSFVNGSVSTPFKWLVPFAVLSLSCRKTTVDTPMPERQGTVTELISIEDYIIGIRGIAIRPDNEWPEDEIIFLEQLFNINQSVTIRSALTDIFLKGEFNHKVIIKAINLAPNPGVQNAKPFDIECKSDAIFTLIET